MNQLEEHHIKALEDSDCFRGMNPEGLAHVISACTLHEFEAGQVIVKEVAAGKELFIIVSGLVEVEIARPLESGPGFRLGPLKPGACFGEISLVDGCLRSATVRARQNVEVLVIPEEKLHHLFEVDPELGFLFMKNVALILSSRIREANIRLRNALSHLYI